jgi:hypothetical protein
MRRREEKYGGENKTPIFPSCILKLLIDFNMTLDALLSSTFLDFLAQLATKLSNVTIRNKPAVCIAGLSLCSVVFSNGYYG